MPNITLAWNNRTDAGTLSGGSWQATLPLTNLQNRQVQKVARSSNALTTSTQFTIDLGAARAIGVVALVVHNISVVGKVRITASDTAGFTVTYYNSGWIDVWPTGMVPQALLEWEEDNFWLGTLSANARAGYQSPFIHLLPSAQNLRYWKVEVDDTGNTDGYVQIGRLFMAATWVPSVNYAYGAGLGYQDPTPIDVSLSGAEYFDVRSRFRVFNFELQYILGTEAYAYALDMQRLCGNSGEVLVVPDSSDTANQPYRAFVGRLLQMGPIQQPQPTAFTAAYQIKELL
jgi:hypothetical protein